MIMGTQAKHDDQVWFHMEIQIMPNPNSETCHEPYIMQWMEYLESETIIICTTMDE